MAHAAGAYHGFRNMKRLGVLLLLLDGMLVHCRLPPAFRQVSLTVCWYPFILLGGEGQCDSTEHNTMTRPGLELGRFDPESSAVTIRPPRLPHGDEFTRTDHKYFVVVCVDLQSLGESVGKASLELLQLYKQSDPGECLSMF